MTGLHKRFNHPLMLVVVMAHRSTVSTRGPLSRPLLALLFVAAIVTSIAFAEWCDCASDAEASAL